MKKIVYSMIYLLTLVLSFTGCSYRALDDKIQSEIYKAFEYTELDGFTSNGTDYYEPEPILDSSIEFKGVNETIPGYFEYIDSEGKTFTIGTNGITYTLRNVEIFDSIYKSGVDLYGCTIENQDFLDNNAFVLVTLSAEYTAPLDGPEEIIASATVFNGAYLTGCGNDNFEDRADGKILEPVVVYFSERPSKNDQQLDYQHQAFSYVIRDGETFTFQVGMLAAEEFIKTQNLYLSVNAISSGIVKDYPYKYFVLFPNREQ